MVSTRICRILLLGWLLAVFGDAHALDPSLNLSQYGLDNWQIPDGLPQSSAQAVARTPDEIEKTPSPNRNMMGRASQFCDPHLSE